MPRAPRQSDETSPQAATTPTSSDPLTSNPIDSPSARSRRARGSQDRPSQSDCPSPPDRPSQQDDQALQQRAGKGEASTKAGSAGQSHETGIDPKSENDDIAAGLSFRQAQAALELCLARLQESDLDVEMMAELYRRALAYSRRCEAVLQQVEQDVMQWDPDRPDADPVPFAP